ncbi:Phosphatidylserine decarboxylase proenzyme [Planctomycetes bacterium Pla163]|uniref:phosphatidylserine decarboxylase n=1 Tax=Rohdeia mirabilis TaxID=2528008 RepID=A0A518D2Z9_9BACT|nr:Phosphatidylserine decarboxylase proenzyme [Planctomycetes bacterium Pla163]
MDHRLLSSRLVGLLADLPLPRFARAFAWRRFASAVGANLEEVERPLDEYRSLNHFFVRRLAPGRRSFPTDPVLFPSPVDGRVQSIERIGGEGHVLQAKGQPYGVRELLGPAAPERLDGWWSWILYLSPRDYHRVHSPFAGRPRSITWIEGERISVAPKVLERIPRVFVRNARAVVEIETESGPAFLVMVGALNVSRIRLEGVETGASTVPAGLHYAVGDELGRFEMGSTVILVTPPDGPVPSAELEPGRAVRLGETIGRYAPA